MALLLPTSIGRIVCRRSAVSPATAAAAAAFTIVCADATAAEAFAASCGLRGTAPVQLRFGAVAEAPVVAAAVRMPPSLISTAWGTGSLQHCPALSSEHVRMTQTAAVATGFLPSCFNGVEQIRQQPRQSKALMLCPLPAHNFSCWTATVRRGEVCSGSDRASSLLLLLPRQPASFQAYSSNNNVPRARACARIRQALSTHCISAPAASAAAAAAASADGEEEEGGGREGCSRLVFLGTPEVAANVLKKLWHACRTPNSNMEVVAVVTQPPSSRGRGRRKSQLTPSAVGQMAEELGIPPEAVLVPSTARDEEFLLALESLRPDLCITAAYGNFLPKRFLRIPTRGTVNIHPSLLPLYRGASPVQRAVEDGVAETGVTVAYTVLEMDAGPIIAQKRVKVDSRVKAPELLESLFDDGTQLLLEHVETILKGEVQTTSQDHALATHAPKVSAEEGVLDLSLPALQLHNKVRAFAGWPGTRTTLLVAREAAEGGGGGGGAGLEAMEVKVITTEALAAAIAAADGGAGGGDGVENEGGEPHRWEGREAHGGGVMKEEVLAAVRVEGEALLLPCADGSVLKVMELQPPSKRSMPAKAFWNGLRGRKVFVRHSR